MLFIDLQRGSKEWPLLEEQSWPLALWLESVWPWQESEESANCDIFIGCFLKVVLYQFALVNVCWCMINLFFFFSLFLIPLIITTHSTQVKAPISQKWWDLNNMQKLNLVEKISFLLQKITKTNAMRLMWLLNCYATT